MFYTTQTSQTIELEKCTNPEEIMFLKFLLRLLPQVAPMTVNESSKTVIPSVELESLHH